MLEKLLNSYKPFDITEDIMIKQLQQFLSETKNAYGRDNLTAHVVADAWITNPNRTHVVMIEHAANKRWMAPGGHCDGNPDVIAGARREAFEEAGLDNLKLLLNGNIFDVNTGYVPLRNKEWGLEPDHVHFDICFAFEAPENAPLKISHESTGLKWVAVTELKSLHFHPGHIRRIEKHLLGILS